MLCICSMCKTVKHDRVMQGELCDQCFYSNERRMNDQEMNLKGEAEAVPVMSGDRENKLKMSGSHRAKQLCLGI